MPFHLDIVQVLINPLNAALNPIRHFLALVGACHFVHVSGIRVKIQHFKKATFPFSCKEVVNSTRIFQLD